MSGVNFVIIAVFIVAAGFILFNKHTNKPQQNMPAPTESVVQTAQTARSTTLKSTVLSFAPQSSLNAPIIKKVGDSVTLTVMIDPGQNAVSFLKMIINYDPAKLIIVSKKSFAQGEAFSSFLDGPDFSTGKISATMSIGIDPNLAVTKPAHTATITFQTLAKTTPGAPAIVTFETESIALSLAANDGASDNVISSTIPAVIVIEE